MTFIAAASLVTPDTISLPLIRLSTAPGLPYSRLPNTHHYPFADFYALDLEPFYESCQSRLEIVQADM